MRVTPRCLRSSATTARLLLVLCAGGAGCTSGPGAPDAEETRAAGDAAEASVSSTGAAEEAWFTERAEAVGLDFVHFNGMSGKFYQPEIMGPGVAMFDYDNDGDLDVYLVQGQLIGTGTALLPPPSGLPPTDRLYRNDMEGHQDGTRLQFTDVTEESGITARGYGMGVATGDIDNDGWVDLYLTGFGRNQMFRNNGDGTFSDVSIHTGTDHPSAWGVPASFLDFDRDGWLEAGSRGILRKYAAMGVVEFDDDGEFVDEELDQWIAWRMDRLTGFVADMQSLAREYDMVTSAAVKFFWPRQSPTGAQDWVRWAREDLLDYLMVMLYTNDNELVAKEIARHQSLIKGHKCEHWLGLGRVSRDLASERFEEQIQICRNAGLDGIVAFQEPTMTDADFEVLSRF